MEKDNTMVLDPNAIRKEKLIQESIELYKQLPPDKQAIAMAQLKMMALANKGKK